MIIMSPMVSIDENKMFSRISSLHKNNDINCW